MAGFMLVSPSLGCGFNDEYLEWVPYKHATIHPYVLKNIMYPKEVYTPGDVRMQSVLMSGGKFWKLGTKTYGLLTPDMKPSTGTIAKLHEDWLKSSPPGLKPKVQNYAIQAANADFAAKAAKDLGLLDEDFKQAFIASAMAGSAFSKSLSEFGPVKLKPWSSGATNATASTAPTTPVTAKEIEQALAELAEFLSSKGSASTAMDKLKALSAVDAFTKTHKKPGAKPYAFLDSEGFKPAMDFKPSVFDSFKIAPDGSKFVFLDSMAGLMDMHAVDPTNFGAAPWNPTVSLSPEDEDIWKSKTSVGNLPIPDKPQKMTHFCYNPECPLFHRMVKPDTNYAQIPDGDKVYLMYRVARKMTMAGPPEFAYTWVFYVCDECATDQNLVEAAGAYYQNLHPLP